MNEGYPPLDLPSPERRQRRKEKSRLVPISGEVLARRAEIAKTLNAQVNALSARLERLSEQERKAVFYKLQHDSPLSRNDLSGTGLKPVAQPTNETTFAAPVDDNLNRLEAKIQQYESGSVRGGIVPQSWLAKVQSIEEGDPKDRLSPDLRTQYDNLCKQDHVICEIEFLSLLQGPNRQKAEIERWLTEMREAFSAGVHGNVFEHEFALPTCRAVIRCSGPLFKRIVEEPEWISKVRWIESRPLFQTFKETWEQFSFHDLAPILSPEVDAPVICIVDTGVSAGNPFLTPITREELLKSYLERSPSNPSDEYGHGSSVASLASYYALNLAEGARNTPRAWIAGARILNAQNQLEDERLFSSLLEEVVRDFSSMGVRIFCLSVGDSRRLWTESNKQQIARKSWVARKLDQLIREYDVLFVTCTGNLVTQEIQWFLNEGKQYPDYLADSDSKILDPGQASLALTVGSVAPGTLVTNSVATAIALENQPSPFSRTGPGMRREIKPELVEFGGNLARDSGTGRVVVNRGLQVIAASHQFSPAACLQNGTSFAAPRVAFKAAQILRDLTALGMGDCSACLIRALLVNSASHRGQTEQLDAIASALCEYDKDGFYHAMGYGIPDDVRATYCDDFSSVMVYDGEIDADEVLFFDIPVPAELADSKKNKTLTVTVVYAPEVQKWGLERYHGMDLKWRMFRGNVNRDEIIVAMAEDMPESDEEIPEELTDEFDDAEDSEQVLPSELAFELKIKRRSRGTVQHDRHHWRLHKHDYSEGHYTLAVAAYKRWQRKVAAARLAVVVRLEDEGQSVQVYSLQQQSLAKLRAEARA